MFAKQSLQRVMAFTGAARTQVAKNAFLMAQRPAMMAAASRAFNTNNVADGAQKLTRALEKEIKYENENYTQLEDIETFLNESGFIFNEDDDGIHMSLKKQVGDKLIEVTFEAR